MVWTCFHSCCIVFHFAKFTAEKWASDSHHSSTPTYVWNNFQKFWETYSEFLMSIIASSFALIHNFKSIQLNREILARLWPCSANFCTQAPAWPLQLSTHKYTSIIVCPIQKLTQSTYLVDTPSLFYVRLHPNLLFLIIPIFNAVIVPTSYLLNLSIYKISIVLFERESVQQGASDLCCVEFA